MWNEETEFGEKVLATVREHGMVGAGATVVVGLSGGPDSLALLETLAGFREGAIPGLRVHAGHLHHGLRGANADADAEFCAAAAKRLGVGFTAAREDVALRARVRGENEEAAGREARYEFLRSVARATGAGYIATGHHADDQVETVLMRVVRGAGPRGMGGIPYVREAGRGSGIRVIRPLLDCTRAEIEAFLQDRGVTPRRDETNLWPKYFRNRLRRWVLPALEGAWPSGLREDVLAVARAARRLHGRAQGLVEALSAGRGVLVQPGYVEAEAEWVRGVGPGLRPELIRGWMEEAGLWGRTLEGVHYDRIGSLLEKAGGEMMLPGEVLACKAGAAFVLCAARCRETECFDEQLRVPGVTAVAPLGMEVRAEVVAWQESALMAAIARKELSEEYLDLGQLRPPLRLRFPRAGDRMRPLGAPGGRKVHDILAEAGVPRRRRGRTLMLTAAGVPVWLGGYRIAHAVRVTASTRQGLHLQLVRPLRNANYGVRAGV